MIKSRLFFPLFMIFLFLSSAASAQEKIYQEMTYGGHGKDWSAAYVTLITDGAVMDEGRIKFTGQEDLNSIGLVTYTFESMAGEILGQGLLAGSHGIFPVGEKGTAAVKGFGGKLDLVSKVKEVKVTVQWKGKTETFVLKRI